MLQRIVAILSILFLFFTPISRGEIESAQKVGMDVKGDVILLLDGRDYFDALLKKINNAKRDILISMYVFKTTGRSTSSANRIKDSLIKAAKRGVDVRVLLEREGEKGSSINSENEYTAKRLIKGGVKVYFDSPHQRTHAKVIVIDRRYTFIGSHNLTASALQYNRELSLMIDSEDVAGEAAGYIEEMIDRSFPLP